MEQETSLLSTLKSVVLYLIVFLLPLFFLPFTQEFFITNKLYFLFFGALVLLLISTLEFLLTKKIVFKKGQFDSAAILLLVTAVLSTVISSPNKIQALVQPMFGVVLLFSLTVIYFFFSREKNDTFKNATIYLSSLIVSIITIFYFFNPLKNVALPAFWQFLKNPYFSTLGSQLDAVYYLGFVAAVAVSHIFSKKSKNQILPLIVMVFSLLAVALSLITALKTKDSLILPPVNLSWYGAVEVLKQPMTALFGVGVDNYSSMFTRVKDAAYNSSSLWQISSFSASRSAFLHVLTEMGVFGLIAFCLLMLQLLKKGFDAKKTHGNKYALLPVLYVVLLALLFPPSLTMMFIIFLGIAGVGTHEKHAEDHASSFDTGKVLPLYAILLVLSFLFIGATGYLVGRSYASELYFKKSLDAYASNNVKNVYENMRQAIMLNPYIERYRSNFSQVNLLIANNIASKLTTQQPKEGEEKPTLSQEEQQTVAQALQAAIEEAKATVTLNPQKAVNWDGLASIYRNIINVAQGADSWTVSAYQRAIVLDPQNPVYRVSLGGILFSFKNYDEAAKLFEQAIAIKPDWPNGYYNLAWAAYQKEDYQTAAAAMQNTVSLLDPKVDETDYKRAVSELAEFKKKLPADESATKEAEQKPSQLGVPTPPVQAPLEPKIKLPEEASPEAK